MSENYYHMDDIPPHLKDELQATYMALTAFAADVNHTIATIDTRVAKPKSSSDYLSMDESLTFMAAQVEVLQLKALAEYSLDIASGENVEPIDIDNSRVVGQTNKIVELPYYDAFKHVIAEAEQLGTPAGTRSFLTVLAPSEITDETHRELYFAPWNRHVAERLWEDTFIERADGSAWVSLPTRLPDVHLSYIYLPGQKEPIRELYRHSN